MAYMASINSLQLDEEEQIARPSVCQAASISKTSSLAVRTASVLRTASAKVQQATQRLTSLYSTTKRWSLTRSSSDGAELRPLFHGSWVCVATWGLGDFLKAGGISYVQRLAAEKAPWPSWEFSVKGEVVLFT